MAKPYKRAGSPLYQVRLSNGKRVSTGERTYREAVKKAERFERDLELLTVHKHDLRLLEAAEQFFRHRRLSPKTVYGYKGSLARYYEYLGDFPLRVLDKARIKHYVEVRLRKTSSIMVIRDLAFLSSLYSAAIHWEGGPETNPVKLYSRKGLENARERKRWLTEKEVDRLLAACRQPYQRLLITLLVETGMRVGEVMGLRWENVHLDEREIILEAGSTKNGDSRIVPLSTNAIDTLLGTFKPQPDGPVFVSPRTGKAFTSFKKCWAGICTRAKLADVRIHDLRHTFASWGLQRGVNPITMQHLLGHKTASMTKRYSSSSKESLHAAAALVRNDTKIDTRATDFVV